MDYHKLLNMAAELGRRLMASGAEIYRVPAGNVPALPFPYFLSGPKTVSVSEISTI